MARFRTRPVEVDAIQWTGSNYAELVDFAQNSVTVQPDGGAMFWSPAGSVWVALAQWVVRGEKDGLELMTDAAFRAKFEPAES